MEMEKTTIYIGEVIKNVMVEKLVTKAELARRLQVKPQSVDYMLTRKSIDTDTLYNVSKALDYDFALLYSIDKEQMNYDRENEAYKLSTAKILAISTFMFIHSNSSALESWKDIPILQCFVLKFLECK